MRRRRPGERGFILLTVLWMSLGLLLAAAGYMAETRGQALATRAEVETGRAVELARSAVNVALADLGRIDEDAPRSPRDGSPVSIGFAEGRATYRIWDEAGKLDINEAPVELLQPVLQRLGGGSGVDAFDAASVAQAIVARRQTSAANMTAETVPLLLRELGLPPVAVRQVARVVTTYNFTAQVSPRTAAPALLAAIPGLGPSDVAEIVARREAGRSLPRLGTASVWLAARSGPVYTIEAEAEMTGGARAGIVAVVAAEGLTFRGGRMRYQILKMDIQR